MRFVLRNSHVYEASVICRIAGVIVIIFMLFNVIMMPFLDPWLYLQEVERPEEVYEITHRVFLDVDIDKQRIGIVLRMSYAIWYFCVLLITFLTH